MSPGIRNQGQPAFLYPRRTGVFAVNVPADFGDQKKVIWTIKIRGQTFSVPGSLREEWQIDALEGEAGSNNTPPALAFEEGGPKARGRRHHGREIGDRRRAALAHHFCDRRWRRVGALARWRSRHADLVHTSRAGSGHVRAAGFASHTDGRQGDDDGDVQPTGRLLLRVRANDSDVTAAGHAQCCWTNAYVKVRVTP